MDFQPHSENQARIFTSTARFIAVITGIQWGKTTGGAVWLLAKVFKDYDAGLRGDYLIAAPTQKILQQSTMPKFKEFFPSDWGVWREQKSCFELNWNKGDSDEPCRIYVRSMDEPEHIEGMTIRAAWLDEAGQMKAAAWTNVQGRLSIAQGPCLMTSTPYANNWFNREVFQRWKKGDTNYDVIVGASSDNPWFPKEEFLRAKQTLPEPIFRRRYLGEFVQLEGLVYPEFTDDHVVEPFDIPPEWPRFAGLDFGKKDPNAIMGITCDPATGIYYVFFEFYKAEQRLSALADALDRGNFGHTLCDPAAAQLIKELREVYHVRSLVEADNDIGIGIERLGSMFKEKKLKVFSSCRNLIDELENYVYPAADPDRSTPDKPIHRNCHALDALRYAFSKRLRGAYRPQRTGNRWHQRQQYSEKIREADPFTGYASF
jgi:PBSX family phage terminase large subunit